MQSSCLFLAGKCAPLPPLSRLCRHFARSARCRRIRLVSPSAASAIVPLESSTRSLPLPSLHASPHRAPIKGGHDGHGGTAARMRGRGKGIQDARTGHGKARPLEKSEFQCPLPGATPTSCGLSRWPPVQSSCRPSRASLVRDARRPVAVHPVTTTPFAPPSSQLSPWTPLVSFLCVALLHREPIAAATITTTPLLFFPVFSRQVQGQ